MQTLCKMAAADVGYTTYIYATDIYLNADFYIHMYIF